MYRKIVVPLDGSKLAECVLPHVEDVANGCGTEEVILVSVTERIVGYAPVAQPTQPIVPFPIPATQPPSEVGAKVPVGVGKKQKQAQRYLERIAKRVAKRLEKKGIRVRTEVLLGNPAEEIASFTAHAGADLILIASHGRSGISRWALGSIADKVFRASSVPVLMVKASGSVPGV